MGNAELVRDGPRKRCPCVMGTTAPVTEALWPTRLELIPSFTEFTSGAGFIGGVYGGIILDSAVVAFVTIASWDWVHAPGAALRVSTLIHIHSADLDIFEVAVRAADHSVAIGELKNVVSEAVFIYWASILASSYREGGKQRESEPIRDLS